MRDNGNLLEQAVSELVSEVPMDTTSHLSADDLAAYHEGRLPSDEDARLADHLAACPQCTSLLLDLVRLQADELDDDTASEFEVAAAWRGLGSRLSSERSGDERPGNERLATQESRVREIQPLHVVRSPRFSPAASLLAASLVAAVVGLSTWVHTLRETVEGLEQRHINAPVAELFSGVPRGDSIDDASSQEVTVLQLTPDQQLFTLIIHLPYEEGQEEYAIEVSRDDGELVWIETGLFRNKFDSLTVILPRRQLPIGEYRIRLNKAESAEGGPAVVYRLRIESSP